MRGKKSDDEHIVIIEIFLPVLHIKYVINKGTTVAGRKRNINKTKMKIIT